MIINVVLSVHGMAPVVRFDFDVLDDVTRRLAPRVSLDLTVQGAGIVAHHLWSLVPTGGAWTHPQLRDTVMLSAHDAADLAQVLWGGAQLAAGAMQFAAGRGVVPPSDQLPTFPTALRRRRSDAPSAR